MISGVQIADQSLIDDIDSDLSVSEGFGLFDWDFKPHYTPANDPENWGLRRERQRRNDCQANALTSCVEVMLHRHRGGLRELSRMFAYQMSEKFGKGIGRDRGSSIHAGVKVARDIGIPLEIEYPYNRYTRSRTQFERWYKPVLQSAATRKIVKAIRAPAFSEAVSYVIAGCPIHWASGWPLRWNQDRIVTRYKRRHGSGAHATAIVWAIEQAGEWLLKVANSHGDGYFLVNERAYEEIRENNRWGCYVLQGIEQPFQSISFV
jgi:hypothetical protein